MSMESTEVKMRTFLIAGIILPSAIAHSSEIVHSNMKVFTGEWFDLSWTHPSFRECGDEIVLAGQNRIVDKITFYWTAVNPVTFDIQITIYKNDGTLVGGALRPNTILWRKLFKNVTIAEGMELNRMEFAVPRVVVPENFTYSTKIANPVGRPCYVIFDPPTIGSSANYVWAAGDNPGTWGRYNLSGADNFAVEVNAIPEYSEIVNPFSFTMFRGSVVSGNLASLSASDDDRLVMRPGIVFSSGEPPVQLVLDGTAPSAMPTAFSFTVEANASFANAEHLISLYNFADGVYEVLDARMAIISDNVVRVEPTGDLSRFVQPGTNSLRAKISYKALGPAFAYPWVGRVDRAAWAFQE